MEILKHGDSIGDQAEDRVCNLRFADDLLLLASSREHLEEMLQDLATASKRVGLEIHMGKTKALSNIEDERREGLDYIEVSGHKVDILKHGDSTKYLGMALSFESLHDTEIQHRMNCGWTKFHAFKKELCCMIGCGSLRLRLHLACFMVAGRGR